MHLQGVCMNLHNVLTVFFMFASICKTDFRFLSMFKNFCKQLANKCWYTIGELLGNHSLVFARCSYDVFSSLWAKMIINEVIMLKHLVGCLHKLLAMFLRSLYKVIYILFQFVGYLQEVLTNLLQTSYKQPTNMQSYFT